MVYDIDYSDEIANLPKHQGYSVLPARTGEKYVTLHYSGVDYPPTNQAGELQRILDEASYQLHHNYGSSSDPAYPDGLLYDAVVLSDGTRVKTRAARQQLWHCGNSEGNRYSWAIHVMTGPKTDVTQPQWAGVVNVIEQLCQAYSIPRTSVIGHNEWPRSSGYPKPNPDYVLLPSQSECPGKLLHQRLAGWRAATSDPLRARTLPGVPGGPIIYCSVEAYDFYQQRGGLKVCGYPLQDEFYDTSLDCYVLRCERTTNKRSAQFGGEFALISEAQREMWL